MEIFKSVSSHKTRTPQCTFSLRFIIFYTICLGIIGCIFLKYDGYPKLKKGMHYTKNALGNLSLYFKSLQVDIPTLHIDIKHINFQKLAHRRSEALRNVFMISSDDEYVPAITPIASTSAKFCVAAPPTK